jgi:polyisoprenoid-binding protein YceI
MSRIFKSGCVVGLALLGFGYGVPAAAALGSSGESRVVFKATGPAGLSFEGKNRDVTLKESGSNVVLTVKLDGFTTGISLRDRHMKEKYLETSKYPTAKFEVDKSKLKFPSGGSVTGTTEGKLTLHGVTRPVKVSYRADGDSKQAKVDGTAQLNIKEFNIDVPSYLGVTVKPNVNVQVQLGVVDK